MTDPRQNIDGAVADAALNAADQELVVGRTTSSVNPAMIVAGFTLLAVLLFLWLNARRTQPEQALLTTPVSTIAAEQEPPPPLTLVDAPGPAAGASGPFSGLPAQVAYTPQPAAAFAATPAAPSLAPVAPAIDDTGQRRRAPALVVDIGLAERTTLAQAAAPLVPGPGGSAGAPAATTAAGPRLNETEQFAQRVGDEAPEQARATAMRNPGRLVPQGAVIPGVLETALNSDLPGYSRAVVSRDVLSFDGKSVLIPRGSRVIGQYKSAVALGQSRAFIIWTRVIRPDGVSVQIGSPGTDALGRGGLDGEVNRHFFRRFSGSILLSVLNAGVAAVSQRPSTEISIGSPGAAAGLASSVTQGDNISPTIKVRQGEAIRIFVARDLDFSAVGAVQ